MVRRINKINDITVELTEGLNVTDVKFMLDKYEAGCSILANIFETKFKSAQTVTVEQNNSGSLIRIKADGLTEVKLTISKKGGCIIYAFTHNGTKHVIMECLVADGILLYNQNGKSTYVHKDGTHEVQEVF